MLTKSQHNAVSIADAVQIKLQSHVCGECEEACWSVRVWLETSLGDSGGRQYIAARDHCAQSGAAGLAAAAMSDIARASRLREQRIWLAEHQERLDLDSV